MSLFSMLVFGVVAAVLLAAVSPPARRFFKSLIGLGSAKLDAASEGIQNADPLSQYKSQIANATEGAKNAQSVVNSSATQLVSLQSQIDEDLKEKTRLENRLRAVLANGDPNKTADRLALDLERVERNLEVNTSQLNDSQKNYDDNLRLVNKFEEKIVELRKDAQDLGFQLERSEAERDLAVASTALKDRLSMTDLSQTRNRVLAKINANKGVAKGQNDMVGSASADEADDDLERKERAAAILARFQHPQAGNGVAGVSAQAGNEG